MASDPRLNLFNFAGTILNRNSQIFGTPHATRCPTVVERLGQASADANYAREQTLGLVGQYANLAADIAGGPVGAGLSTLAKVSNEVRVSGVSALPSSAIGNGQQYVLQTLGMDPNKLTQAAGFNPNVANTAFGAASQVYNSVSQGKFSANDIPAVFSAFQNGTALISSLFNPNTNVSSPQNSQFGQSCGAGNYATDLIALAPKYKFLFVVEFEFDPAFRGIIGAIDPAFVVKSSSRPNIDFEYEDINMYNFRTKVAKKTTYQPITMKFLDDDKNNAFQFYNTYLKILSPIANIDNEITEMDPLDKYDLVGGGMGFDAATRIISSTWANVQGKGYAASLGAFGEKDTRNILRRITIYHVYKQGRMMNVMHFYNPKITKMELDDLDMASSDGTEVGLTFSYDSLYIIPGYQVFDNLNQLNYNLPGMTSNGLHPFGQDPSMSFDAGDTRDGVSGVAYGQDSMLFDSFASQVTATSLADLTTTLSGSSLLGMASVAPTVGGGGTGAIPDAAVQGLTANLPNAVTIVQGSAINPNSAGTANPSSAATITSAVIDPVTGIVPASANNKLNIANVTVAAQQWKAAAQQQLDTALASATTPEQTQAAQQTFDNSVANTDNTNYQTNSDLNTSI